MGGGGGSGGLGGEAREKSGRGEPTVETAQNTLISKSRVDSVSFRPTHRRTDVAEQTAGSSTGIPPTTLHL